MNAQAVYRIYVHTQITLLHACVMYLVALLRLGVHCVCYGWDVHVHTNTGCTVATPCCICRACIIVNKQQFDKLKIN